ncbi:methyl-accepting chemotaxis sensory transducer [Halalkalibacter wakoensis JCM 9140]|uniref:Methyl-accepting chemotaxis sensory transducer n=2 Tax=Halalkalibacter wakoensis TaxID=127891 RepID=W4Q3Z4_9BACI|nr:methyl-accepting chemotaxis sensory transducer [Halalkalibacter wakoensis JCM 9140]
MGRGFGVVAEEIRKLSNETVSSTEKIRTTLTNIQKSMDEISASIEKVVEVGNDQAASTQEIASFIDEIEKMSKQLNKYASDLL